MQERKRSSSRREQVPLFPECTAPLHITLLTVSRPPSDKLISSSLVSRISLHNRLPRWAHAYVLPFVPLYPLFAAVYFFKYDEYIGSGEWTFVFLGSIITLNTLCWLCVHWSVTLEALFTARPVLPYFDPLLMHPGEIGARGDPRQSRPRAKPREGRDVQARAHNRTLSHRCLKLKRVVC